MPDKIFHNVLKCFQDVMWRPTANDNLSYYYAEEGLYIIRHVSFQGLESYYFIHAKNPKDAVNEVLRKM